MSQTTPETALAYRLTVRKAGVSEATIVQGGTYNAYGGTVDTLAAATFTAAPSDVAHVELVISAGERVISRQTEAIDIERVGLAADFRQRLRVVEAPDQQVRESTSPELEIAGFIVDDTRTKPGRDFYGYFYRAWQPPADVGDFAITIKEFPSRGRIARVGIEVDGQTVYTPMLQPRQAVLEATAQQAVNVVTRHLQRRSELEGQLADPDQAGSGLY